MSDFLSEKRNEIQARLKELRPLVDEYHRLEAAERALAGVDGAGPAASPVRRSSGTATRRRTARAKPATAQTARRGRPKGSGTRAKEALEIVGSRPGISIPEMAEAMGIKQNYLYRVMPGLVEQGLVTKSGRGWHLRK
jgi:hypothetical protein